MVACWRGEILGEVSVEVVSSQGPTGSANVVRRINNPELGRAARLIAAHLGSSGFFGLDFIIEQPSGKPYLIEMNPRCTQLGTPAIPGSWRSGECALGADFRSASIAAAAAHPRRQNRVLSAGLEVEHAGRRLVLRLSGCPLGGEAPGRIPDARALAGTPLAGTCLSRVAGRRQAT